jgi:hypothetical protein
MISYIRLLEGNDVVALELGHIFGEAGQFGVFDVCRLLPLTLDMIDTMKIPFVASNEHGLNWVGKGSIKVRFSHLEKEVWNTTWGKKG